MCHQVDDEAGMAAGHAAGRRGTASRTARCRSRCGGGTDVVVLVHEGGPRGVDDEGRQDRGGDQRLRPTSGPGAGSARRAAPRAPRVATGVTVASSTVVTPSSFPAPVGDGHAGPSSRTGLVGRGAVGPHLSRPYDGGRNSTRPGAPRRRAGPGGPGRASTRCRRTHRLAPMAARPSSAPARPPHDLAQDPRRPAGVGWESVPVADELRRNAAARIAAGRAAGRRGARLRGHRPPAARERPPGRPRRDPAGRAGPGQDPPDPVAGRPARRVAAGRRRLGDQRRPVPARPPASPGSGWPSEGDETPIDWVHRSDRYGEKLATPDTSIADLIGEVDPIKVAEGRYLSDELTLHYGLVPRVNRGIFAINELPDLAERIQVGPAQRARGARRPDPRPPDPPARST